MKHIKFVVIGIISAVLMALLEVQIEGSKPWAEALPTWRVNVPVSFINDLGLGGKPLTGYHTYLWLLVFSLLHFTFVGRSWSIKKELRIVAFFLFFTTLEGVLWFVFNTNVGIKGFLPHGVNLTQEPWRVLPTIYWARLGIALVSYIISNLNTD
jgi:hypothetical protein